ncbi:MAG: ComEA family DNA-binding protein [Gordonia sp. (in: high G+C Gram-positive bacteria)]
MSDNRRRNALDRLAVPPSQLRQVPDQLDDGYRDGSVFEAVDDQTPQRDWGIGAKPMWLEDTPTSTDERIADFGRSHKSDNYGGDNYGDDDFGDDDEDGRPRHRIRIAPPGAIALVAIGVIACAIAAYGLFRSDSGTPEIAFPASAGPTSSASSPPVAQSLPREQPAPVAQMVVSVVGLVHRPGLIRLAPRSRVAEAITRAGGPRSGADMMSLNLAQILNDGDQILVGYAGTRGQMSLRSAVVGSGASAPVSGGAATGATESGSVGTGSAQAGGKVNLNTATEAQLDALPGVGPVTAKAIIQWRSTHGMFTSVTQLGEVDGIGPARLAKLKDLVTV